MKRTIDTNKLNQLLLNVPGSYPDFVEGTRILFHDNPDALEKLVSYIEDHPMAQAGEIIAYMNQFLPITPHSSTGHSVTEVA